MLATVPQWLVLNKSPILARYNHKSKKSTGYCSSEFSLLPKLTTL
jgi:hypothetical protein